MQDMMSYSGMFGQGLFSPKLIDPGKLRNMVLKNKKTGMVVEVRDVSAYAAVKHLKWRPRHTLVLEETLVAKIMTEETEEEKETNAN